MKMLDSGKRRQFASGAVRDVDNDKPRPDLISPFFKERLGNWLAKGAIKYEPWNWAKGMPMSTVIASLERHIMKFQQGLTDEDHLAGIAANAMFLLDFDERIKRGLLSPEFDDMRIWYPAFDYNSNARNDSEISPTTLNAIDESRQHKTDHYEDF
jgi:hypothetical protein